MKICGRPTASAGSSPAERGWVARSTRLFKPTEALLARTPDTAAATAAFLGFLENGWSVTAAAQQADVARETVYRWRARDKTFAAAWDHAIEIATDKLEDELRRRAVEGGTKTTEKDDNGVVKVTQASDRLLIALLAARRPERYRPVRRALEIQSQNDVYESARQRLERKLDRMAQALRAADVPGEADG